MILTTPRISKGRVAMAVLFEDDIAIYMINRTV